MRLRLVCVGKPRDRGMAALHDEYAGRIVRLGTRYEASWAAEVRPDSRYADEHVRQREAAALLEALDAKGTTIALDRTGELLTSERFAGGLENWATPLAVFVIGGPLGLHADVLSRADRVWSLSPLTFPHELVRVLAAEQIYRALAILRGLPYHK